MDETPGAWKEVTTGDELPRERPQASVVRTSPGLVGALVPGPRSGSPGLPTSASRRRGAPQPHQGLLHTFPPGLRRGQQPFQVQTLTGMDKCPGLCGGNSAHCPLPAGTARGPHCSASLAVESPALRLGPGRGQVKQHVAQCPRILPHGVLLDPEHRGPQARGPEASCSPGPPSSGLCCTERPNSA